MIHLLLNDQEVRTDLPSGTLLLDFIRYHRHLKGTKIGCREGDCGACTVLIGECLPNGRLRYRNATSCLTPLANVAGKHVVTIEGLNMPELSPVQSAMVANNASQCGFCTVGFVVSMTGYCLHDAPLSEDGLRASIDGNICRCTGYKSIERAGMALLESLEGRPADALPWLVERGFLPGYFGQMASRLRALPAPPPADGALAHRVGGGTDAYVQRPERLEREPVATALHRPDFKGISVARRRCTLGGATTPTEMLESPELLAAIPRLPQFLKLVSSSPIRNISTLAGNFVNASPIGDLTALFLALDATLELENPAGHRRQLPLRHFYLGYKTLAKEADEWVAAVHFDCPPPQAHVNFEKVCKRTHLDIASVNTAAQVQVMDGHIERAHVSAGGVGPIPLYLEQVGKFLAGKRLSAETVLQAGDVLQESISPISDVRGTADYKRLLLRQLFYAHFITLFPRQVATWKLLA